jgi:epoxyqueuosine reductase
MSPERNYSDYIKQKALSLGFSACGIAPARKLVDEEQRLNDYLVNNFQGEMEYMANHFDKRLDPTLLVPGAKSVIVVLLNYFPNQLQTGNVPIVSKYAYGKDYHVVVKDKLHQLFQFIHSEIKPVSGRVFSDSAPVLERAWAVQAGLGWIGKNGLLINKELGSFFFIGEIIIDLELEYDSPFEKEHCGNCEKCLRACPTGALVQPSVLDARRCISYLTIEMKEDTPQEYKPLLSNRVFGCDICQDVCPWNQKPECSLLEEFQPSDELVKMSGEEWSLLSKDKFDKLFSQSPVKRAGYDKLMQNIRNLKVAFGVIPCPFGSKSNFR